MRGKILLISAAILLAGCGGGAAFAASDVEKQIKRHGKKLPNVIRLDDFRAAAIDYGMVEVDDFLAEHDITVVGEGDSAYLRKKDLIRACGDDCDISYGMGELIYSFAVRSFSNR